MTNYSYNFLKYINNSSNIEDVKLHVQKVINDNKNYFIYDFEPRFDILELHIACLVDNKDSISTYTNRFIKLLNLVNDDTGRKTFNAIKNEVEFPISSLVNNIGNVNEIDHEATLMALWMLKYSQDNEPMSSEYSANRKYSQLYYQKEFWINFETQSLYKTTNSLVTIWLAISQKWLCVCKIIQLDIEMEKTKGTLIPEFLLFDTKPFLRDMIKLQMQTIKSIVSQIKDYIKTVGDIVNPYKLNYTNTDVIALAMTCEYLKDITYTQPVADTNFNPVITKLIKLLSIWDMETSKLANNINVNDAINFILN